MVWLATYLGSVYQASTRKNQGPLPVQPVHSQVIIKVSILHLLQIKNFPVKGTEKIEKGKKRLKLKKSIVIIQPGKGTENMEDYYNYIQKNALFQCVLK